VASDLIADGNGKACGPEENTRRLTHLGSTPGRRLQSGALGYVNETDAESWSRNLTCEPFARFRASSH
jgi:hypothetical protein